MSYMASWRRNKARVAISCSRKLLFSVVTHMGGLSDNPSLGAAVEEAAALENHSLYVSFFVVTLSFFVVVLAAVDHDFCRQTKIL